MITKILAASLSIAALSATAALASGPDEFSLEPVGVGSSSVVYSPDAYTTAPTTIAVEPAANTSGNGQFEEVNIDDYIVPDTGTSN